MPHIAVYAMRANSRSQLIAAALFQGAKRAGYQATLTPDGEYTKPRGDVAAFYGFQHNMPKIMDEYVNDGRKVVFIDLGYWGRHAGGRWRGYHKAAINARHPGGYIMDMKCNSDRFNRHGVAIKPWRKGGTEIVLAGMSEKSAASYGYGPQEWERWAAAEIRKHTKRPIIYRPKPSWKGATAIPGTSMQTNTRHPIQFDRCHAVVTHHSNVAIDGLVEGVPAYCWDGAAVPLSSQKLATIEAPEHPDGREQWAANLAWCQWNVSEMKTGVMWSSLRDAGIIK